MSQNPNTSAPDSFMGPPVPSPCVGVCTLRGDTCYGCGRTTDEIAAWADLAPAEQAAVWALLPARLAAFGFRSFRLAASAPIVDRFIGRTFAETTGRWRVVTPAIEGGLRVSDTFVTETATAVSAAAADGTQIGLRRHEKVRVFGFQRDAARARMDTVALVLPKGLATREAEAAARSGGGAVPLAAPDRFSRAWLAGDGLVAEAWAGLDWAETARRLPEALGRTGVRLRLENAVGWIETRTPDFTEGEPTADANAPADVKVSKAFVAGAIFEADDPDWLAAALAPI